MFHCRRFRAAAAGLLFVALPMIAPPLHAEPPDLPVSAQGALPFDADVAAFLAPDGRTRVRIFLEVPYRSLRFVNEGTGWKCRIEVTAVVYDRGGNQLNGDLWTESIAVSVPNPPEGEAFRKIYELEVTPGRLNLEIKVTQVGSGRTGTWTKQTATPLFDVKPLSLSGLVFGRCDLDSARLSPGWAYGEFFPSARRRYGETQPVACVYGEIYDTVPAPDSLYTVTYQVFGDSGKPLDSWTDSVPRAGGHGAFLLHPSVTDLKLGVYRLKVEVKVGGVRDQAERSFEVDESRFDLFDDREMVRGVMSYVATNEELIVLEDLPDDSLSVYWGSFWARRDPTPDAPPNENLVEFIRRVQYANANFSVLGSGWNSDMGRIYIRYGQPDQIDRVPFGSVGPPREVWTYYDRNRQFVFADTDGFGRYRLVGTER